jgi:uncharacterized protein with HEPN domain
MSRSTVDRLGDILQSAELAAQHAGDLDAETLAVAPGPRDATLFRLAVVCEAASRLPAEIQALAPEIEWRNIRSMRNLIIHDYWQIDIAVVVDTIVADLPQLRTAVLNLIALVERNGS